MVKIATTLLVGAVVCLFGGAVGRQTIDKCKYPRLYVCKPDGEPLRMNKEQTKLTMKIFASVDQGCTNSYESEHLTPGECTRDELDEALGFNSFNYEINHGGIGENRRCWFRVYDQYYCHGASQDFPAIGSEYNTCHRVFGDTPKLGRSIKLICEFRSPPKVSTTLVTSNVAKTYANPFVTVRHRLLRQ